MDGRGRAHDNIFIERLWWTVKYEEVYLNEYDAVKDAVKGIDRYFYFYNNERPHQALGYKTPCEVYQNGCYETNFFNPQNGLKAKNDHFINRSILSWQWVALKYFDLINWN